ncbi:MAG TPA: hypothetical protein VM265_11780 [Sphingomicrobium sp.]|nr:hypothetical protein [Sphingomicrobium sp.]
MSDAIKQPEPEQRPQETPGQPGTPVLVEVYAQPCPKDQIAWSSRWKFRGSSHWQEDPIVIPAKKADQAATPIQFDLIDSTGRGLKFEAAAEHAIWSRRNQCPDEDQPCHDSELELSCGAPQLKRLTVLDRNTVECSVFYRLRFRDRNGKPVSYDPEIRNGGNN